jgi:hypothetical protein
VELLLDKNLDKNKPYEYTPADFQKWFECFDIHRPVFITGVLDDHLGFGEGEQNIERIIKNNLHFWNDLHRRIYRKSKRKIPRIVVIETGKGRLHSHMIVETPEHLSFSQYKHLLSTSWRKTRYGLDLDVRFGYSKKGLDRYCSKELFHRETIISQVDVENCCMNKQKSHY